MNGIKNAIVTALIVAATTFSAIPTDAQVVSTPRRTSDTVVTQPPVITGREYRQAEPERIVDLPAVVDKNRKYFAPDNQFGFGVNNSGGHIQYALSPAFHLGLNLNLDVNSTDGQSETTYDFGPYAKFLFEGRVINPYVTASLGLIQRGTGSLQVSDTLSADLPDLELRPVLGVGGEHFFNENVGVYGHVDIIDSRISPQPSTIDFGLLGGTVGVEFFF